MQWMNSSLHSPSSPLDPAGLQTKHWTSHLLGGGGEGEKGHALWPRLGNIPALKWGGIESMLEIFTRTTGHNKEATCQNVKGTGPTKTRAVHCASSGRILAFSKNITCGPAWMLGNEGSGQLNSPGSLQITQMGDCPCQLSYEASSITLGIKCLIRMDPVWVC